MKGLLERLTVFYSVHLPYHPGKWRVVNAMLRASDVQRRQRGRTLVAQRRGVLWRLSLDCWVQRELYYHGDWDTYDIRYLLAHLPADAVFFDVGAYFGYYALLVARWAKGRPSVAFEPLAANHERLAENVRLNGLANVRTFQVALADAPGEATFLVPPTANQGSGHLAPPTGGGGRASERVQVTTIDRFVAEHAVPSIAFMKIDVEGAELQLLRGAAATLRRFQPGLIMELNPTALRDFGTRPEDLLDFLFSLRYRTFEATKRGLKPFPRALTERADLATGYTNLVCLPEARIATARR